LSLDFGLTAVTRVHLRQLIRRWHALVVLRIGRASDRNLVAPQAAGVRNPSQNNEKIAKQCEQVAEELAKILKLPRLMKGLPKRVKALSFLPDDVLHGLPFAALRCDGRYLIEKFAVGTFVEREEESSPNNPDDKHALLVHVVRGNSREGLSELPGTQRETKALGKLLAQKGVQVETLGDDQATKRAVLSNLPNCSLFHIACHGTFVRNRADLSGLILLPADNKRELLSFVDLSKLDLTGVQHATLSSCWSADNFILPGRWIISLPEALNRAGVGSVLASFWKVNDDFAVSFMTRFFKYLDKHPRDQALRRVQLDCLNGALVDAGPGIVTSDPFYWANYTLHGEHKKLRLRR
jgi:CHAT domain-containing protein